MNSMLDVLLAQSVSGGGSAPTLIEKSITENGTYVASDDSADGYSQVTVNVPQGGGGSVPRKGVNFYDYDGTLVYSYTAAEFANISAMPDNPSHDGLTAQGWNWGLADAKAYVANYGSMNISQMYITSDGKTRLYISLPDGRTSPVLQLYLNANSELDIDWGDNSTHSTFTSTASDYKSERHEYSASGDYVIAITVVSGGFVLQSSASNVSSILWNENNSTSSPDRAYNNAIKKVEIGDDVTSIGNKAFYYCSLLSSVTIPDGVTSIGNNAFNGCYSLSSITISDGVTSIGIQAFQSCYLLSSVTIPDGVTSIWDNTFYYCSSLSSITIPDGVTYIGNYAFNSCSSLSSITIPDGVTSITDSTFQSCSSLSSIIIPDTVTSIKDNAFSSCSSLSSITIPDGVTSIGRYAFSSCSSLSSITILDGVTSIGSYAFQSCSSLSSITIPDTVTSIGNQTFSNCSYMSYIKFESTTPPTVSSSNAWLNVSTSTLVVVPVSSYDAYKTKTNYPNPSSFIYLAFGTYTAEEALPATTSDGLYSLVWYASMDDAEAETNPIIVGNGNEVYARATAV